MLERAREIVDIVSKETDSIILFHSLSGKDSIALLDIIYPKFRRVVCVYMYLVPNLEHMNVYYRYAKARYPNVEFIQIPHYGFYSYVKEGYMGIKKNDRQKLWTLAELTEVIRKRTGIEWAAYGFKQSDSLNRRLMLRSYKDGKEAMSWKTKKVYPLSTYKNSDVLAYIRNEGLKEPETYGGIAQSCGCAIDSYEYQSYLREHYPGDLEKIYGVFPQARIVLLDNRYKDETVKSKRNGGGEAESNPSEPLQSEEALG